MKILIAYRAIHNTAGGVERISSWLMNELVKSGHQVHFVTLDQKNAASFYPLDPTITWHRLALGDPAQPATFSTRLSRILSIRKIAQDFKPDVAIGFQEASYLSARLALAGTGIPVIAAERNSPSRFKFMNKSKLYLAFASFFFAKFVTIQSPSFTVRYPKLLRAKLRPIPNPVFRLPIENKTREKNILSVGRLEYQKNFQSLLMAFCQIADDFPEWTLTIVGEGHDKAELETIAKSYGLNNRVHLVPNTDNVALYYGTSSIFCLPSRWEGFPNALAEALTIGLPSVGFFGCDGVSDLIKNGHNGFLAEGNGHPANLAACLSKLMEDEKLRDEMSQNAISIAEAYKPTAILKQWEQLLKDAVSG